MQIAAWPYEDKGDAPLSLITSSARHAFIPRGKPRGILQIALIKVFLHDWPSIRFILFVQEKNLP
jgi:hypothetical protein